MTLSQPNLPLQIIKFSKIKPTLTYPLSYIFSQQPILFIAAAAFDNKKAAWL